MDRAVIAIRPRRLKRHDERAGRRGRPASETAVVADRAVSRRICVGPRHDSPGADGDRIGGKGEASKVARAGHDGDGGGRGRWRRGRRRRWCRCRFGSCRSRRRWRDRRGRRRGGPAATGGQDERGCRDQTAKQSCQRQSRDLDLRAGRKLPSLRYYRRRLEGSPRVRGKSPTHLRCRARSTARPSCCLTADPGTAWRTRG
jgi:hypothetical protein